MKKVTGIGGVFFKCENPEKLKKWYAQNLGLKTDAYGTNFEWRQGANPQQKGFTQWGPFAQSTSYFSPSDKEFMINYRVENLADLLKELQKNNVQVLDPIEKTSYGDFVHILDLEGNKIELWQPVDEEYDKIVDGRTY